MYMAFLSYFGCCLGCAGLFAGHPFDTMKVCVTIRWMFSAVSRVVGIGIAGEIADGRTERAVQRNT